MRESVRRIQQNGYSKPLLELVKRRRTQKQCVKCIRNDNEHAFFILIDHDGLNWNHEGVARVSSSVLCETSNSRVIEVDVDSHELLRVNGEEVSGVEHAKVLDLSDDGERWEGDVLDNQPYGWGVLYDSEGEKAYEGFRIGEVNVFYGRSYYPDVQKVEYDGGICEGKRWGRGIQYDRNGKILFDGEWMNDEQLTKRVVLNEKNQLLHNHIEELIVSNNSCNGKEWSVFDLSFIPKVRLLEVGDDCFENVKEVKMMGLKQLERVVIGKKCFTKCKGDSDFDIMDRSYMEEYKRIRELDEGSVNYYYASLELKSDSQGMK